MIIRKVKKAYSLGLRSTLQVVAHRLSGALHSTIQRQQAHANKAHYTWGSIAQKHAMRISCREFFSHATKQNFPIHVFLEYGCDKRMADQWTNNIFSILGSEEKKYPTMPWHSDIRLDSDQNIFDPTMYYKDFVIEPGVTDALAKDIKLPWELSRFQHSVILGNAYYRLHDQVYPQTFKRHVNDWLEHNRYLFGPNWVCPMDVAIRSINWIIGFYYFNQAIEDDIFWENFICSLYDHMMYLEKNWEVYDTRTSNHYLSDLIGYFYLCYFFQELSSIEQKMGWCWQELLRECDKQVFQEGTDYEGSTRYHQLVTEIFYLMYSLGKHAGFQMPEHYVSKLRRMFTFIDWCTPKAHDLLQIGDNDSGKIVGGISRQMIQNMKLKEISKRKDYTEFGISIIKTSLWHVTLRHHVYNNRQPSGHFHSDSASMTLYVNGIALFVDPGSYIYTPSAVWRNYFRSVQVHNTFFIKNQPPIALDNRLFYLEIPENDRFLANLDSTTMHTEHNLYQRLALRAQRTLRLDEDNDILEINDSWLLEKDTMHYDNLISVWNFTLAPGIEIIQNDLTAITFFYQKKPIASLTSTLSFSIIDGWYSDQYGSKVATKRLWAENHLCNSQVSTKRIHLLGSF